MRNQRDLQLEWLDAVLKRTGWTVSEVAERAGLDHSSLSKFRSGKSQTMRRKNILRISAVTGVAPPHGSASGDFSEGDAVAFDLANAPELAIPAEGGQSYFAVELTTSALSRAGFEPGDVLIFDAEREPENGDIVCAQKLDERFGTAETIIRLYEKPYLISPCVGVAGPGVLIVNDKEVQIRGVLMRQIRVRNFTSAA